MPRDRQRSRQSRSDRDHLLQVTDAHRLAGRSTGGVELRDVDVAVKHGDRRARALSIGLHLGDDDRAADRGRGVRRADFHDIARLHALPQDVDVRPTGGDGHRRHVRHLGDAHDRPLAHGEHGLAAEQDLRERGVTGGDLIVQIDVVAEAQRERLFGRDARHARRALQGADPAGGDLLRGCCQRQRASHYQHRQQKADGSFRGTHEVPPAGGHSLPQAARHLDREQRQCHKSGMLLVKLRGCLAGYSPGESCKVARQNDLSRLVSCHSTGVEVAGLLQRAWITRR